MRKRENLIALKEKSKKIKNLSKNL